MARRSIKAAARLTIKLPADTVKWLEQQAAERSTTVSDVIRRTLDETRGDYMIQAKRAAQ